MVTWGTTVWSSLSDLATTYESTMESMAFSIEHGKITSLPVLPYSDKDSIMWDLLSGATLWAIWKNKCKQVFKGIVTPPVEAIKEIWAELIYNLTKCGQV